MRVTNFSSKSQQLFKKKKARSNLLHFQRHISATLHNSKEFLVIHADKNLGPAIIERNVYINRALKNQLLDKDTYRELTPQQANIAIQQIKKVDSFLSRYSKRLYSDDIKYLQRTANVKDPFAKFYLTAKVHKNPRKTRPICVSLLHGLGRWVDKVLQPLPVTPLHLLTVQLA
jgi:hypothetical protein